MPFLVFLFFGFVIYMKPEVLYYPVIIIVVVAILLLIFKSTTKKQSQNHLIEEPVKKATQSKDNSLYQSYQSSQKQSGQKPTKNNTSWQKVEKEIKNEEAIATGKKGELLFMQWLKDKNIPFIYLDQEQETYNYDYINEEGYYGFKRVDYIIKFNGGLIGIDVKNLKLDKSKKTDKYSEYRYYSIEKEKDLARLRVFEEIFQIPVFYVFLSKRKRGGSWEWASLDTVKKCYLNKYHCYQVSYNKTRSISDFADLSSFFKRWSKKVKTTQLAKTGKSTLRSVVEMATWPEILQ